MRVLMEPTMEPYDLEQIVREETRFIDLAGETCQRNPAGSAPDLQAAAREIELAIDALHPRHPYDLPMQPEYMFDPHDFPDPMVLILSWSMPEPF
jgi:hypothetical protein